MWNLHVLFTLQHIRPYGYNSPFSQIPNQLNRNENVHFAILLLNFNHVLQITTHYRVVRSSTDKQIFHLQSKTLLAIISRCNLPSSFYHLYKVKIVIVFPSICISRPFHSWRQNVNKTQTLEWNLTSQTSAGVAFF